MTLYRDSLMTAVAPASFDYGRRDGGATLGGALTEPKESRLYVGKA
jgi:hypothetical protein